jgi:hypothetical protein
LNKKEINKDEKTDIEDFERRNIYDVPEGFFKDMQSNVLERVAEHKSLREKYFL